MFCPSQPHPLLHTARYKAWRRVYSPNTQIFLQHLIRSRTSRNCETTSMSLSIYHYSHPLPTASMSLQDRHLAVSQPYIYTTSSPRTRGLPKPIQPQSCVCSERQSEDPRTQSQSSGVAVEVHIFNSTGYPLKIVVYLNALLPRLTS